MSSGTSNKTEAKRMLQDHLLKVSQGRIVQGKPITLSEVVTLVRIDHENNGKGADNADALRHVVRIFGEETKARDIQTSDIEQYKRTRLQEKAARATVNLELAWLRRGLRLARRHKRLGEVPEIVLLSGTTIRRGFLEPEQFESALRHVGDEGHRDLMTFLYLTGWRKTEGINLEWRDIDRKGKSIRIEETKSRYPRTITYDAIPGLEELIEKRYRIRPTETIEPRVFGRIKASWLNRQWRKACRKAGHPGWHLHDFRRSMVRNLLRIGIPQNVIMMIGGWKTQSIFNRYAIIDENLMRDSLRQGFERAKKQQG